MDHWQIVERPGYFGRHREQRYAEFDKRFGTRENWKILWQIGEQVVDFAGVILLYEDGYLEFLRQRSEILQELTAVACDVYDDAPSNVESGFDYSIQETNLNHWHDIAIRRTVLRLGASFKGDLLMQVRHSKSNHPLGMVLSPGQVPFHRPDLILSPQLERYWWEPNSVESFYQSNKVLCARE